MTNYYRRRLSRFVIVAGVCAAVAQGAALQLGSRSAEEWVKTLDTPQRITSLKIDEVVSKLRLKPGQTVADIGAGTGLFEGALAHDRRRSAAAPGCTARLGPLTPRSLGPLTPQRLGGGLPIGASRV